ncbi:MAG: hypothetical protein R3F37_04505 [Candidatus Competibacteraceae bacterium]
MEATGPYHEAAALAHAGAVVSVVNPKRLKDFASSLGLKARTIPGCVCHRPLWAVMSTPAQQPDPPEYRHLKRCSVGWKHCRRIVSAGVTALEKAQATATSAAVLDSLERSLAFLETEYQRLRQQIDEHINRHPKLKDDRQLLASIPGIGRCSLGADAGPITRWAAL